MQMNPINKPPGNEKNLQESKRKTDNAIHTRRHSNSSQKNWSFLSLALLSPPPLSSLTNPLLPINLVPFLPTPPPPNCYLKCPKKITFEVVQVYIYAVWVFRNKQMKGEKSQGSRKKTQNLGLKTEIGLVANIRFNYENNTAREAAVPATAVFYRCRFQSNTSFKLLPPERSPKKKNRLKFALRKRTCSARFDPLISTCHSEKVSSSPLLRIPVRLIASSFITSYSLIQSISSSTPFGCSSMTVKQNTAANIPDFREPSEHVWLFCVLRSVMARRNGQCWVIINPRVDANCLLRCFLMQLCTSSLRLSNLR